VSWHAQTRTILQRASQPQRGTSLLPAHTPSELGPCISSSSLSPKDRFFAWRRWGMMRAIGNYGLLTLCFLRPEEWQTTERRRLLCGSNGVPIYRYPSAKCFHKAPILRIFPVFPLVTRFGAYPAPSGTRRSASPWRAPYGSGFPNKNLPAATAQRTGEIFLRSLHRKTRLRHLGAGHLASLRAGVSRGQSGQIQTGEITWHSTKTTSS
jgi:hypothetical protein